MLQRNNQFIAELIGFYPVPDFLRKVARDDAAALQSPKTLQYDGNRRDRAQNDRPHETAAGADNLVGVDADRIKGIGHQLKGALKEGLGSITGDAKLEAEGVAERGAGKAQNAAGSARDTARDVLRDEQGANNTSDVTDTAHDAAKRQEQSR